MVIVILAVIGALIIMYLVISAVVAFFIARPSRSSAYDSPAAFGLGYEEIIFKSRIDNLRLKGWYIPGGDKGTIIVIHGGKQNRADASIRLLELCVDLAKKGFDVLTFDRRGCGESEVPGLRERSFFNRDIGGAVDYIRSRNNSAARIFLLGTSIGAVAALIFAGTGERVSGIVSDSCFANTIEMARTAVAKVNKLLLIITPGAQLMGKLIYNFTPVNATDSVGSIICPVLFIHSAADDGIPAADAYKLFEASNKELNDLWVASGAGHSGAYMANPNHYIDRVTGFFLNKCTLNNNLE